MVGRVWIPALLGLMVTRGAAAQDVDGTWHVTWAQGIRVERDESIEVTRWGEGDLRLRQVDDSVSGVWTWSVEGIGTARWIVVGTFRAGRLDLMATEREADEPALARELGGIESLQWEGALVERRLEGEMWLIMPEMGSRASRRPWSAERRAPD